jgi:hypothetical protein
MVPRVVDCWVLVEVPGVALVVVPGVVLVVVPVWLVALARELAVLGEVTVAPGGSVVDRVLVPVVPEAVPVAVPLAVVDELRVSVVSVVPDLLLELLVLGEVVDVLGDVVDVLGDVAELD